MKRDVLVGTRSYGLYIGQTAATDAEIVEHATVRLENCRSIRQWRGRFGGITSLAAFGPCGPRIKECLIGAPTPSTLITNVEIVHDLAPAAVEAFASVNSHDR